jgi:branched-chain amino acid transport system ATP-binding protein
VIAAHINPRGAVVTTATTLFVRGLQIEAEIGVHSHERIPAYHVVARDICHCPEGRRLSPELSVLMNLQLGAYLRSNKSEIQDDLDRCSRCFQF